MEHQNRLLKQMWRSVGSNLNEKSAARLAGTLDSVEIILNSIYVNCKLSERSSHRSVAEKDEAVQQITVDLMSKNVFRHSQGRPGHPSFNNFSSSFLSGLDYRDLHTWMKKLINTWGSIYQ